MTTRFRVALQGFSDFERDALTSSLRLAGARQPSYRVVPAMAGSDFIVADADHERVCDAIVGSGRLDVTIFVGDDGPEGASALIARPIDPIQVLRALDRIVAARHGAAAAPALVIGAEEAGSGVVAAPARVPPRRDPPPATALPLLDQAVTPGDTVPVPMAAAPSPVPDASPSATTAATDVDFDEDTVRMGLDGPLAEVEADDFDVGLDSDLTIVPGALGDPTEIGAGGIPRLPGRRRGLRLRSQPTDHPAADAPAAPLAAPLGTGHVAGTVTRDTAAPTSVWRTASTAGAGATASSLGTALGKAGMAPTAAPGAPAGKPAPAVAGIPVIAVLPPNEVDFPPLQFEALPDADIEAESPSPRADAIQALPVPSAPEMPLPQVPEADEEEERQRRLDAKNAARAAARRARLRAAGLPEDADETIDVLVLDDSEIARRHLGKLLEAFGFRVHSCERSGVAIHRLATQAFAAVFLDIVLADDDQTDGLELCRRVHAGELPLAGERPKLMVVSGQAAPADRVRAKLAGCDVFLSKPLSRGDVARAFEACRVRLPSDARRL